MSVINYEDIPSRMRSILEASPEWTDLGISIFVDIQHLASGDGTAESKAVEEALQTQGICLGLESFAAVTKSQTHNLGIVDAMPRCVLLENPRVNRSSNGAQIMPARAARILIKSLLGQPADEPTTPAAFPGSLGVFFRLPDQGPVFEAPREAAGRMEYPIRLQIQTYF